MMDMSVRTTRPPGSDIDAVQGLNMAEKVLRVKELCEEVYLNTRRQIDGALPSEHGCSIVKAFPRGAQRMDLRTRLRLCSAPTGI
jgi:hypothetical protein